VTEVSKIGLFKVKLKMLLLIFTREDASLGQITSHVKLAIPYAFVFAEMRHD